MYSTSVLHDNNRSYILKHFSCCHKKSKHDRQMSYWSLQWSSNAYSNKTITFLNICFLNVPCTGKSYIIMCLRKYIEENFSAAGVAVCAPTGTAAFNISGKTVHSTLSIPAPIPRDKLDPLRGQRLLALQERLSNVKLLIIDEMSMIGRTMLRCIDLRLREVHPSRSQEPFGGVNICLFGDFGQLPPVMDQAMYSKETASAPPLSKDGVKSFKAFKKAVILRRVERV